MPAKIKPLTGKFGDFSGIVLKAAASGNAEAVRHYLEVNPAWLDQEGPHGRTLLWEAAYRGHKELVAELIERGADVNPLGSYYTPMLVELSPLAVARERGDAELMNLLIANGAADDLHSACYRGDLEAIDAFLTEDPDAVNRPARPDAEPHPRMGWNPIHYAAVGGRLGAVRLLVGHGAEVGEHLPLLLDWAQGNREMIRYLRSQSGARGKTARPSTQPKIDPNVPAVDRPDWMGFPLLVDACRGNHNAPDDPGRVRKLLKRGANVNVRDHKQKTPLHRSSQAGFTKITTLLLERGAEMEAADETGRTPLFDAAYHGRAHLVELLLERGANLHHTDRRGETALFAAARRGWQETVEVLLAAGANPAHANAKGKTAADVLGASRTKTPAKERICRRLRSQTSP